MPELVQSISKLYTYICTTSGNWRRRKTCQMLPGISLMHALFQFMDNQPKHYSLFVLCSRNILGWECKNRCWIMHCSTGLGRLVLPPPPACLPRSLKFEWQAAKQQYIHTTATVAWNVASFISWHYLDDMTKYVWAMQTLFYRLLQRFWFC